MVVDAKNKLKTFGPDSSPWPLTMGHLRENQYILARLIVKELQIRYKQTRLGWIWIILQPALMMIVFTSTLGRIQTFHHESLRFSDFCLPGIVVWLFFSNSIMQGTVHILEASELIKQVSFPRSLFPFSLVMSRLPDLGVGLLFMLAWSFRSLHLTGTALFLPVAFLSGITFTVGAAFFLSAVCIKFRDLKYILPFLVNTLFFLSPIVYSMDAVGKGFLSKIIRFNPVTAWIEALRTAFLGIPGFKVEDGMMMIVTSLGMFVIGSLAFRKVEKTLADTL